MLILKDHMPMFHCSNCRRLFYNPRNVKTVSAEEQLCGLPKFKVLCPLCGRLIYSVDISKIKFKSDL